MLSPSYRMGLTLKQIDNRGYMEANITRELPLASTNLTIPCLGFGTATYPFNGSTAKEAILHAIKLGWRHFDTAAIYGTESCLGESIAEALALGLIRSRDELFITSKLWFTDAHKDRVLPAIKDTLKKLGLEYLNLYLIHCPVASKQHGKYEFPFDKKELVALDLKFVWEDMEECQKLGLTKSIGVSNFSCKKLDDLLAVAKIPPAVNQVEMNPVWQQKKLREFCKEKGIHITAYSPLGGKGTPWGTNRVMECELLKEIAGAKGKFVAQVCLRWAYEQDVSFLVKSFDKNRIEENFDIFDWELSPEDLQKISEIPQQRGSLALDLIHEEGPYKSAEELWDGEL